MKQLDTVSDTPGSRPWAYSYIRFSRPEQIRGDSLRRQLEKSEQYAEANGLLLVRNYEDHGLSAWKGLNQKEGQLKDFVSAVERGAIPYGSHLLVESLDRLSRQKPRVALSHFLRLIDLGLTLHTLVDRHVYSAARIDDNLMLLFASIMVMGRSSEESEIKSDRVGKAKANARKLAAANGKVMSTMAPAWLRIVGESDKRCFEIVPERAAVIERIYDLTINGLGAESIVRTLNKEGIASFSEGYKSKIENGWHKNYIRKIIVSRAVCGDFEPLDKTRPTIPGYYPRLISEEVWERAKAARLSRTKTSGPHVYGWNNLFSGISYCAECGGTLSVRSKGVPPLKRYRHLPIEQQPKRERRHYFICDAYTRSQGCTNNKHLDYAPVERAILDRIWQVSIDPDIIDTSGPQMREIEKEMAELKTKAAQCQARLDEFLLPGATLHPAIMQSLNRIAEDKSKAMARLQSLADQLARLRATTPPEDHLEVIRLLRDQAMDGDVEIRARLNAGLRGVVDAVVFAPPKSVLVMMAGFRHGMEFEGGEYVTGNTGFYPEPPQWEQWLSKIDIAGYQHGRAKKRKLINRVLDLPKGAGYGTVID